MTMSQAQNPPPSLVYANYSQLFSTFMQFSRGYSFQLCCFGNSFMTNIYKLTLQKQGLAVKQASLTYIRTITSNHYIYPGHILELCLCSLSLDHNQTRQSFWSAPELLCVQQQTEVNQLDWTTNSNVVSVCQRPIAHWLLFYLFYHQTHTGMTEKERVR